MNQMKTNLNGQVPCLEELVRNASQNALLEISELLENALRAVKVTKFTVLTVVTDFGTNRLALVVELNFVTTLAVRAIALHREDQVIVAGGRATASRGIKHATSVPCKLAMTTLLDTVFSVNTGLELVRALRRSEASDRKGGDGENGSKLHCRIRGY